MKLFVFLLLLSAAPAAQAHLPYLEENNTEITVAQPEISKAYYGWLNGMPAVYTISSPKPFKLYLNLMSPQLSDARVDFSADIYDKDGELIQTMNGIDFVWLAYYEPFANDYYIRGPEYEADVPAGIYQVEVRNSSNYGDYVLTVGQKEDQSLGEFIRTMAVLPEVKEKFFGKTGWEAYQGFAGMYALGMLTVIFVVLLLLFFNIRRRILKNRLDNERDEYKNNRGSRGKNYIDLSEVQRLFGGRL